MPDNLNPLAPWMVGLLLIGLAATVWDPVAGSRFIGYLCAVVGAYLVGSRGFTKDG